MRFEDAARQHAKDLYRYAYWLARNREQAQDIVQEALLRSWRAYPRLRDRAAVKSWLFSIVRNEYLRTLESRAPPMASIDDIDVPDERSSAAAMEMREAIGALPASYAEPLVLQVLGGFSCSEIAAMLCMSEGATMTRLTRARQALRKQRCAIDGVHGDVHLGAVTDADALAVVQHRCFVLLALTDNDNAVDAHALQDVAHGIDGGLIDELLVAPAHVLDGRHRRGFSGANQLHSKVAFDGLTLRDGHGFPPI